MVVSVEVEEGQCSDNLRLHFCQYRASFFCWICAAGVGVGSEILTGRPVCRRAYVPVRRVSLRRSALLLALLRALLRALLVLCLISCFCSLGRHRMIDEEAKGRN